MKRPSLIIKDKLIDNNVPFKISDNISEYICDEDKEHIIEEVTDAFANLLNCLVIDTSDPNTKDTAKRLAKMYVNELFNGRYEPKPEATAFPNNGENAYKGLLVVRSEIRTTCAHHFQPVRGVCYIGIIPNGKVIGLSKYARIAQWCAKRGTLQEELCNVIAEEIKSATECRDVGVYLALRHGCMENRGIEAHSSLTQTTVLCGQFQEDGVKAEFMNNVHLQELRTES
jgi:GTP cyclohydrolase I